MKSKKNQNYKILDIDKYLLPYEADINLRMDRLNDVKKRILQSDETLVDFANGHMFFGFHRLDGMAGYVYREWAPEAEALHLIGDLNNWDRQSHPLIKKENGVWEIVLDASYDLHMSRVKVQVTAKGTKRDRIPLYITRVVKDDNSNDFKGQVWLPEKPFKWFDSSFKIKKCNPLLIYECHVGMAQEEYGVGTFKEFTENNLPWIKDSGYNAIQLMAIAEHPYYASFGYHVSNFFAVSSRFGTPEDLKYLINTAHNMGIAVFMDLVHSHAVKNINEGINRFDGTQHQFFHSGDKGNHIAWDSKVFDYSRTGVIHFLLSNIKYWMDEYHFDGFRFDGVTSMLYHHHGLGVDFDNYSKYFSMMTDIDAVNYLQLASELIKSINPNAIAIAEDMSGMPGMCLPIKHGGIGFDYRLSMGIPDFWIKMLELRDEHWNLGQLWYELTNRRPQEKNIGYSESHDQALVGDKTIMFRLADKEMYWHMDKKSNNLIINRALALEKMIKFITLTLSGEGYLNFMGNEFGHPEWIDFPREGNGWSYHYARRQWSLAKNDDLKYKYLYDFDKAIINFVKENKILDKPNAKLLYIHEDNKVIAYEKGGHLFIFNFHYENSYRELFIQTNEKAEYKVVLSSDDECFGGYNRISNDMEYKTVQTGKNDGIVIYSPCRTVMVLKKEI